MIFSSYTTNKRFINPKNWESSLLWITSQCCTCRLSYTDCAFVQSKHYRRVELRLLARGPLGILMCISCNPISMMSFGPRHEKFMLTLSGTTTIASSSLLLPSVSPHRPSRYRPILEDSCTPSVLADRPGSTDVLNVKTDVKCVHFFVARLFYHACRRRTNYQNPPYRYRKS